MKSLSQYITGINQHVRIVKDCCNNTIKNRSEHVSSRTKMNQQYNRVFKQLAHMVTLLIQHEHREGYIGDFVRSHRKQFEHPITHRPVGFTIVSVAPTEADGVRVDFRMNNKSRSTAIQLLKIFTLTSKIGNYSQKFGWKPTETGIAIVIDSQLIHTPVVFSEQQPVAVTKEHAKQILDSVHQMAATRNLTSKSIHTFLNDPCLVGVAKRAELFSAFGVGLKSLSYNPFEYIPVHSDGNIFTARVNGKPDTLYVNQFIKQTELAASLLNRVYMRAEGNNKIHNVFYVKTSRGTGGSSTNVTLRCDGVIVGDVIEDVVPEHQTQVIEQEPCVQDDGRAQSVTLTLNLTEHPSDVLVINVAQTDVGVDAIDLVAKTRTGIDSRIKSVQDELEKIEGYRNQLQERLTKLVELRGENA